MERTLFVEGQEWHFVKERIYGGAVYTNDDRSLYLRSDRPDEIAREVEFVSQLGRNGYPVGQVVARGTLTDALDYWVEASLGSQTLGQLAAAQSLSDTELDQPIVELLSAVLSRWTSAQRQESQRAGVPATDWQSFAATIWVDQSLGLLPTARPDIAAHALQKLRATLTPLPEATIATDLNVFNILPAGVIDFEGRGRGPIGYDAVGAILHGAMFPDSLRVVRISDRQIDELSRTVVEDQSIVDGFIVAKAFWCAGSKPVTLKKIITEKPQFARWRAQVRDAVLQRYVDGEPIRISEIRNEIGDIDGP